MTPLVTRLATPLVTPLVTAHAGCMGTAPNSRASILAAFASRSDIVEVDIRVTKDGVVVLAHDDRLALSSGKKARVAELAWNEVQAASASSMGGEDGAPETVMRLETFLDLATELEGKAGRGLTTILNLDAKDCEAIRAAAPVLRARGLESRVLFSGLGMEGIALAAATIPDFSYLFNADAVVPLGGGEFGDMERACSLSRAHGCGGINLEWTRASSPFVDYAAKKGLRVMLWTVDEEADMRIALSFRPHSITTNRPDLLAALMATSRREETHVL
jgi:glycerophosphoryl diester phosphodiesterase